VSHSAVVPADCHRVLLAGRPALSMSRFPALTILPCMHLLGTHLCLVFFKILDPPVGLVVLVLHDAVNFLVKLFHYFTRTCLSRSVR